MEEVRKYIQLESTFIGRYIAFLEAHTFPDVTGLSFKGRARTIDPLVYRYNINGPQGELLYIYENWEQQNAQIIHWNMG